MKQMVNGLLLLGISLFSLMAVAEVPSTFTLNAQVYDPEASGGFSYEGGVKAEVFAGETGGAALWSEIHANVIVEAGFLTLDLGSVNTVTPLADVLLSETPPLFIEITLAGLGETFPARIPITSVPYAIAAWEADNATTFQNMTPEDFSLSGHTHVWADITGKPAVLADDAVSWSEVQSKPLTFDAAPHDHAWVEITSIPADLSDGEISWSEVTSKPSTFPTESHNHDDRYFTELELSGGELDTRYYTRTQTDTRYYTRTEADATFALITALNNAVTRIESLETMVSTLQSDNANQQELLEQLEDHDCPPGYERVYNGQIRATGYYCRKAMGEGKYDEMVKVGDFWIDRYEASIYSNTICTGTHYGLAEGDAHNAGFFRNGMDDPTPDAPSGVPYYDFKYACSVSGTTPSRYITWFQAQQACSLMDKHLCTNAEWQAAAYGTPDDSCNISSGGVMACPSAMACISHYGAHDMVGNLWEWTANWNLHGGVSSPDGNQPDDGEFHGDGYWNVENASYNGTYTEGNPIFPASALRGGYWGEGSGAGVFALYLRSGPADFSSGFGFRCCMR